MPHGLPQIAPDQQQKHLRPLEAQSEVPGVIIHQFIASARCLLSAAPVGRTRAVVAQRTRSTYTEPSMLNSASSGYLGSLGTRVWYLMMGQHGTTPNFMVLTLSFISENEMM